MAKRNYHLSRFHHTGKSKIEKNDYVELINAPQEKINDTIEDSSDVFSGSDITDSGKGTILKSRKIIKEDVVEQSKAQKSKPYVSLGTKLSKNIRKIIWDGIIVAILITAVGVVWGQQKDLGKILANIDAIKDDITKLQNKYDDNTGYIDNVKIITQIQSDLAFLKERLIKVELKVE